MSKLYWKLRSGGIFKPHKYQMYRIWIRSNRTKYRTPIIKTYPRERWGYGYWSRK